MASILKVDNLRGNTAAGNITITGEGGSGTIQFQQGLAKGWVGHAKDSSQSIEGDTFNVSGFTDSATGHSKHQLTSIMNTGVNTYPVHNTATGAYDYHGKADSSSQFQLRSVNSTGNSTDGTKNGTVFGDLA
jgi:hypothetical protein|tara:strand:- start:182 stop:577 length:396 start_codon:yes stop_codon:yes gene_type:complete